MPNGTNMARDSRHRTEPACQEGSSMKRTDNDPKVSTGHHQSGALNCMWKWKSTVYIGGRMTKNELPSNQYDCVENAIHHRALSAVCPNWTHESHRRCPLQDVEVVPEQRLRAATIIPAKGTRRRTRVRDVVWSSRNTGSDEAVYLSWP